MEAFPKKNELVWVTYKAKSKTLRQNAALLYR